MLPNTRPGMACMKAIVRSHLDRQEAEEETDSRQENATG